MSAYKQRPRVLDLGTYKEIICAHDATDEKTFGSMVFIHVKRDKSI